MKANTHPKTNKCTVKCACGNTFESETTTGKEVVSVEICNKCHPFYTGKQKVVDRGGRIDRFQARYNKKSN